MDKDKYYGQRKNMVVNQIKARGVTDERVLSAMMAVPRHKFIPKELVDKAYGDYPLPIEQGQTISQPYIVAVMTELLKLKTNSKVLEIGTGSGYQAAILSLIAAEVYTIEIKRLLADKAEKRLLRLGYHNVKVRASDGYYGWEYAAPFDAIVVTCAANHIPPPLLRQLKDGGRLVIPLGSTEYFQTLTLVTRDGDDYKVRHLMSVRFVPMTGEAQRR
ncbi:MAG: protein-L-isoaspartate(D-aspartate) O-methyltransferase [Deltaproteobacteria bacterium]|uniref:Protein-L-isoaspartate O-methyltransferase n=1 Tax=Candidatus Zymogenus saltonus TaxID=2844893 RepID=A0A9D8PRB5_9DELT|nr:protein-L-isoaspartate(D-aspartate) O-methyltransferase [Candidatus Zymogenus saltonus]